MGISANRIVYKEHDGFWANKLKGEKRPSTFHRMLEEAIASAGICWKEGGGELTVKGEDVDQAKDTLSPGDPRPSQR